MQSGASPAPPAAGYAPSVVRLRLERGGGACLSSPTPYPAAPERLDASCASWPATHSGCPVGSEGLSGREEEEVVAYPRRPSADRPPRQPTLISRGPFPVPPLHPEGSLWASADAVPATTLRARRRHRRDYHPPLAVGLGLSARRAAVSAVAVAQPFFRPTPGGAPHRRPAVPLREPPSPTSIFCPASPRQGTRKPGSPSLLPVMGGGEDSVGSAARLSSVSRTGVGTAPLRQPTRDRSRGSIAGAEARGLIVSPWVFPTRDTLPSRGPRLIRRMVSAASGKGGYAIIVPRQTAATKEVAGASGAVERTELHGGGDGGGGDVGRLVGGADHASKASIVSIASSSAPWWSESPAAPTTHARVIVGASKPNNGEPKAGSTAGPPPLLPLDLDEPRSRVASDGSVQGKDTFGLELDLDGLESSVSSASVGGDAACPLLPPPTPPPPPATTCALPVDVLCASGDASATAGLPPVMESVVVSLETDDESGSLALDPAPRLPISRRQRLAADSWLSDGQSHSGMWSRSPPPRNDAPAARDLTAISSPASPRPPSASSSPKQVLTPLSPRLPPLPPPSSPSIHREPSQPSSRRPPLPPRSTSRCSPRSASLSGERSPLPEGDAEVQPSAPAEAPPAPFMARPRRHIFWGGVNSTASTVRTWSSSMSSASAMSVSSSGTEEETDVEEPGSSRRSWFLRTVGAGTTRSGLQSKRPPGLPPLW